MCGVLAVVNPTKAVFKGSSPHVRGFETQHKEGYFRARFIPACAGFCQRDKTRFRPNKVHPRMCGVLS